MAKESKCTAAEIDDRVNTVFELICQGKFDFEIYKEVAKEKGWDVGDRQIANYVKKANELLKIYSDYDRKKELGKAIARYNLIFKKAFEAKDYQACIRVQDKLNKLMKLLPD